MKVTPLKFDCDSEWLIHESEPLSRSAFLVKASAWADQLPGKKYVLLLCEQRHNFISGFVAAQLAGQTVLLPANRTSGAIIEIAAGYSDCYCLTDSELTIAGLDIIDCRKLDCQNQDASLTLEIDSRHVAAVVFTSGSTGTARPNEKTWGSLVRGAYLAQNRFGFDDQHSIIATVPPQHMYGLETTVMVPLVAASKVYGGRPFYPEDIRLALDRCSGSRVLITTPIHLHACVASALEWPEVAQIISATAPLNCELREQAENTFSVPISEIYGCTEAGSLASRQPSLGEPWQLYDDFKIDQRDGYAIVNAPHLDEEIPLADVVNICSENEFILLGRQADLINVAGKRASLNDLNIKLNAISGVEDGVFLMPEKDEGVTPRLAALIVAPALDEAHVLAVLAEQIDPVFLPRPLCLVDALPRNEMGKLPRQALLSLLESVVQAA